jgi:hypothetical protein
MRQIHFFATPTDIKPVLRRFERNAPLKFVEMGTLTTPNRTIYLESAQIPKPGIATHETASLSKGYMVSHRDTKDQTRASVTRNGEKRWNLFAADNEEAVGLGLAGLWKTGTLLPGSIHTVHQNPVSQQLMKWFQASLSQEGFEKVREWWVGHEAMRLLQAGKRLATTAEQSPAEYDLQLPK